MNDEFLHECLTHIQTALQALQECCGQGMDYNCNYGDSEHADISPSKARKILHDGSVHGHPLSDKQHKFFGAVASRGE